MPATLPAPFEAHALEAKLVHLAWRVQAGLPLYPDWRDYPHVCNFYSPYFLLVAGSAGSSARSTISIPRPGRDLRLGPG